MKKIILFLGVLLIGLFLIGCSEPEEDLTPPEVPEDDEGAETPEADVSVDMLSELRCFDNEKIEAVITNTGESAIELAKDVKVLLNGMIVVDPECDTLVLAAGESTACSDISGHIPVRDGTTNTVQLNLAGERIVEYVECAEE